VKPLPLGEWDEMADDHEFEVINQRYSGSKELKEEAHEAQLRGLSR